MIADVERNDNQAEQRSTLLALLAKLNAEYERLSGVVASRADEGDWAPSARLNAIDRERQAVRHDIATLAGGGR